MSVTAKRFLQEFRVATDELESLTEEHDRIISRLMSMTQSYGGEGGSSGTQSSDSLGDGVAALVDICREIDEEVKHYASVRDSVRSVVRAVAADSVTLGQCLHYRYIMFDDPSTCASRMGYTDRQERNIHRAALKAAAEKMEGMAAITCRRASPCRP